MPILEKKFIGHSILGQMINQVKGKENGTQGTHLQTINHLRQKWLTKEMLIEWMDQNEIFVMIFGESFHPEVIKKSYFLLEFLYNNKKIGEEQLNMMWDCAM